MYEKKEATLEKRGEARRRKKKRLEEWRGE